MTAAPIPSVLVKPTKEFGKQPDVGRSKRYAREDHDHGAPDLTQIAVTDVLPFADTVSTQQQFSSASTPGVSTEVSRADHNHGTPDFDPDDKEDVANKVTSLSGASTDTEYPSAKAVWDELEGKENELPATPADPTKKFLDGNRAWAPFPVYKIPSGYVEMTTPVGTTSATLEDVSGASTTVTLVGTSHILVNASFEVQTQSGASASTIGVAININGTDHDEMQRYLTGSNDLGLGAITHRSATELSPGTYTVKVRFRRVSGVATPGLNKVHMVVTGLEAQIA